MVDGLIEIPEREQGAGQSQRNGKHDDQRVSEALELGGQNQVDEDQRKHEHKEEAGGALHEVPRLAGESRRKGLVQLTLRDAFHRLDAVADGLAGRQCG